MNKQEFEDRIKKEVTPDDWDVIGTVYTWHPEITDTKGKDQIALIYKKSHQTNGDGMIKILEMLPRAEFESNKDTAIRRSKAAIELREDEYELAKKELNERYSNDMSQLLEWNRKTQMATFDPRNTEGNQKIFLNQF